MVNYPFNAELPLFFKPLSHLTPAVLGEIFDWKYRLPRSEMFYPTLVSDAREASHEPPIRNPTNLPAECRTSDCVGSKSAPGSFLEYLRHLLRRIELGKVMLIEENRLPSSVESLTSRQSLGEDILSTRGLSTSSHHQSPGLWGYHED